MTLEDLLCRTSLTITFELAMRIPRREIVGHIQDHALSFRAMIQRNSRARPTSIASSLTGTWSCSRTGQQPPKRK
jgi:hypothetical protein